MKKMIVLAMMMTIAISASAMTYSEAKYESLFLSDKMAYELNLTSAQHEAVYAINLDYMMRINGRSDVYGVWWNHRNTELSIVLTASQYKKYLKYSYFTRPVSWSDKGWIYNIYSHYGNKSKFYNAHPNTYYSYKGGVTKNNKNGRVLSDNKSQKHFGNYEKSARKENNKTAKPFGAAR